MKKIKHSVALITLLMSLVACVTSNSTESADTAQVSDPLYDTILALDTAMFDAFNKCSDPQQLQKNASYFTPDVEFYHDNAGVTWSRKDLIVNTEKNVCGKFSRELIPGTLKVYPIKGYGAIALGSHRFCQFDSGKCDGLADFTHVWVNQNGHWQITRVLSYAHRSRPK